MKKAEQLKMMHIKGVLHYQFPGVRKEQKPVYAKLAYNGSLRVDVE